MPGFVESYAFLGDAYSRLGAKKQAVEAFLELDRRNSQLRESLVSKYIDIRQSYENVMQSRAAAAGAGV